MLALGGFAAPLLLCTAVVLPSATAGRVVARVVRLAAIATLPLAVAVLVVQGFGGVGATPSTSGFVSAAHVAVRLFVMAAALALFGLTTPMRALVADLERRGASPRVAFAAASIFGAVPALAQRARIVREAQRARGLDIDGGVASRLRAVVPLVAPVVAGTLHSIELRSLALEARGFGRPIRRELLWAPADSRRQRRTRWGVAGSVVVLIVAGAAGLLPRLP